MGLDKTYEETLRLGVRTDSDDAVGEIVQTTDASGIAATQIATGVAALTGRIAQVPSTVSAIKVGGRRAYDLARAGEQVELTPREVTVSRFEVIGSECSGSVLDLEVVVDCSSGTYIRALARDLGAGLGVGGHLTALRRTHVGPFDVSAASGVDAIDATALLSPAAVASAVLGRVDVTADEARDLRHGRRLAAAAVRLDGRPRSAAIDPEGRLVGVVERRGADLKSAMNMSEAAP
ncbi:MAG: tRNA pseudouridine synthase B [Microbacterium sp.]|uniref:tRNA pseudouridine synthase B n=1 Tax=Microbacterium sp. TaxID=51671 RepID=UPI003A893BDB